MVDIFDNLVDKITSLGESGTAEISKPRMHHFFVVDNSGDDRNDEIYALRIDRSNKPGCPAAFRAARNGPIFLRKLKVKEYIEKILKL